MSTKYPGGLISKTPPTPSGPYANSTAPGVWTLEQQAYWVKQGNWPTQGAVDPSVFIENLFSTYLYTGASGAQSINNGIDLSTNGGMLWLKDRTTAGTYNYLADSVRGPSKVLSSNTTGAQSNYPNYITSFNTNGFTIGAGQDNVGDKYASWTFRKQPKFFDIVTYTGNGTAGRQISHALGSVPGCVIVKKTSNTGLWATLHKDTNLLYLERTNAAASASTTALMFGDDTSVIRPTSTVFTVGSADNVNTSGETYVAYLFAHNAGGFGLTGTDNVISCGSFTADVSGNATVSLGYEPQWLLVKRTSTAENWWLMDNMRGLIFGVSGDSLLFPNTSGAETNLGDLFSPSATGFTSTISGAPSESYIYIAIRRGPMQVPTSGTSVFSPTAYTGLGTTGQTLTTNFPVDMFINCDRTNSANMTSYAFPLFTRLLSLDNAFNTSKPDIWAGGWGSSYWTDQSNTGLVIPNGTSAASYNNQSGITFVNYNFRRAPNFMDVVCYAGNSSTNQRVSHNLGVAPELIITKTINTSNSWWTYVASSVTASGGRNKFLALDGTYQFLTSANSWGTSDPTATDFGVDNTAFGYNGYNIAAYLFVTCPGVSKVGSYTGTGATQTISCGFTGGARFVLIKRTDSTGGWYVWDTARGMVSGTDPSLLFNVAAAEVNANSIYTATGGFQIVSTAAGINASGGNYIFLAIA